MISSQLTLLFLLLMLVLCSFQAIRYVNSPDNLLYREGNYNYIMPILLTILFIFWFGSRRIFLGGYMDTANYGREYNALVPGTIHFSLKTEWLWYWIMSTCKSLDLSAKSFFTVIEAGYLVTLFFAIKIFLPRNLYVGLLFAWSSLFFLPFGVNGIRNGLACHVALLGIAQLFDSKNAPGALLCLAAFGIHRSTMLPIAATVLALTYFKNVKVCIYLWLLSIVASLLGGGWFMGFFGSLGFDERMSAYSNEQDSWMFSNTGFRWDFLLYSALPVYMAWYICVKREISDNWYNAICTIYLICNAFWVLVIRASYSNRFAYLSWFIYPVVIAYPLLMMPVWHNQDNKIGTFLMGYIGFTFVMNILWRSF